MSKIVWSPFKININDEHKRIKVLNLIIKIKKKIETTIGLK